jgi:hypothetical protein
MKSMSKMAQMMAMLLTALFLLPGAGGQMAMGQGSGISMMTLTSRLGGFTVLMPGRPSYQSKPVNTKAGVLTLHSYNVETHGGDFAYSVMFNDYPAAPTNIKSFFDRVRDGATEGKRLLKEVKLDLNGYPGRGMVIEDDNNKYFVADYLVGMRLYQLIFSMRKDGQLPANAGKFLNSFELLRG